MTSFHLVLIAVVGVGMIASAGERASSTLDAAVAKPEASAFDQIWDLASLYEDKSNTVLQKLALIGRFHGQYHWADGSGLNDDAWETRRNRLGLEATLFEDFKLRAELAGAPDFEPLFNGFSNLAVQWQPSAAFCVIVGKQLPKFTYDFSTSSNVHPYIERSQLVNQFHGFFAPGISCQGKIQRFSYYAAAFSDSPSDELSEEFSSFDGGGAAIVAVGYDVKNTFHTDAADARLEYLYSGHNDNSTIYERFDHGVAASLALRDGHGSLATELLCGLGADAGDAVALNLMPGWFVTDKLQLVARYQLGLSNGDAGLLAQRRYERTVGQTAGDRYQAGYAGFNYLIYGPKLRLMGGVEFANLSGRESWTALLGVRLFWDGELAAAVR